jgi:hypothetical protein
MVIGERGDRLLVWAMRYRRVKLMTNLCYYTHPKQDFYTLS